MFKLVSSEKEIMKVRAMCADGFFGARINTTLAAYGADDRFVRTWYEEKEKGITAAVQLTQETAVVHCTQEADFESLAVLLQFTGAKTVLGEEGCILQLGSDPVGRGFLMEAAVPAHRESAVGRADSEQLSLLYPVLFGDTARQERPADFAAWYADLSHRVRHGLCDCYAVFREGCAVSCAAVLYSNAQYGCIGAVATRPQQQGKGYGTDCTLAAAHAVVLNGLTPCLACADSGIHKWYEKMGFCVCGAWAELCV